ncbi:MAG: iron-siderophore ABC transporter substrate-binding protein [Actinomycetia bacterium]|nr:iron-siderophore ABC transporter substrate-binding protein [Actinomycetes bacterium]
MVLGSALLAASALAACGDESDDAQPTGSESAGGAFPVTIDHTFGETTIEQKPERIVTLGWNAQDIVYALGHEPVGMPSDNYGVTDQHIKPWLTDYFDPEQTTLLDTTDGPPLEEIAALDPDVILAPYEGFDEQTYKTLSAIAPTVAYPGKAWQTTWQKQTSMIGQALGQNADAKDLIDEIGTLTDKVAKEHPEFEGKTVSVLSLGSENYVYMPADPRVQLLNELGFENASGVEDLAEETGGDNFAPEVPKEEIDSYDADVVIAYADGVGAKAVTEDPVYANLDSFKQGSAYVLDDKRVIGGMSAVSVLSVPWVIDQITPGLAKAAKAAEG